VTPLCTYRDYHSHLHGGGGWQPTIKRIDGGIEVQASAEAHPYRIVADAGEFYQRGVWYYNFNHRRETRRGLDDTEDLFRPGYFNINLEPEQTITLICSTEPIKPHAGAEAYQRAQARQAGLSPSTFAAEPDRVQQLLLAADQFIVERDTSSTKDGQSHEPKSDHAGATIIAGYPWFSDWGRDTMIALPGLTLAAHRPRVAANILQTYANYVSQGMLPNRFPDVGQEPEYNTADATLWYFHALHEYIRATGDLNLAASLYPILTEIINWHERGTRYGIKVDPYDSLLSAGEGRSQLTWMDAKIGDWVVTPRIGKPVEVNALWHHALCVMARLAQSLDPANVDYFTDQAE
jgi:predicted glycogen debranching enzyme